MRDRSHARLQLDNVIGLGDKVVGAGPGLYDHGKLIPNDFKVGDRIIFQDQVGIPVDFGESLLMVKGCYVLGTVDLPDEDISPEALEKSRIASENLSNAMKPNIDKTNNSRA